MKSDFSLRARFCCLLALLLFAGCDSKVQQSAAPVVLPAIDSADSQSTTNAAQQVTDEEAENFAADLVQAIETRNVGKVGQLIAWREIVERALASFSLNKKTKGEILAGALSSLSGSTVNDWATTIQDGGSYRFVKINRRGGDAFAVMRLIHPTAGFNYHQWHLQKKNGKVRADQMHVANTGQELSETLRSLLAPSIATMSISGRLSGAQDEALADIDKLKQIKEAIDAGDSEKAIRVHGSLTPRMRNSKEAMLMKITATSADDEEAYSKVIDEFLQRFPNDPAAGFASLDAGVLRSDPQLLFKAYELMNSWSGGDPYFDLMVGGALAAMGELEKAKELIVPVDVDALALPDAHDYRLTLSLAENDHSETLKQLQTLRDQYGYEFDDLRAAEGFEEFVKSQEFNQW